MSTLLTPPSTFLTPPSRPLSRLLELRPVADVAYSRQHGAEIRKQWKDMVLAGRPAESLI